MKSLITSFLSLSIILFSAQINYAEEHGAAKPEGEAAHKEKKKEVVLEAPGHTASVNVVIVSPDGKSVISGSTDKTIRFWDLSKGTPEKKVLKGHSVMANFVSLKSKI